MANTPGKLTPLKEINPASTINVRLSDLDHSIAALRESIKTHGFLPEHPVLLRPDPKAPESGCKYEIISGQCRTQAARLEGITAIPAIIVDLDDETAHKRSFNENQKRTQLGIKDLTYWYTQRYEVFKPRHGSQRAIELTAQYYNVKPAEVREYLKLAVLPEPVQDDIAKGLIARAAGRAISASYLETDEDGSAAIMTRKAEWLKALPNADRKGPGIKAIANTPRDADDDALDQQLETERQLVSRRMNVSVPDSMTGPLTEYGRKVGLTDLKQIVPYALNQQLKAAGYEVE